MRRGTDRGGGLLSEPAAYSGSGGTDASVFDGFLALLVDELAPRVAAELAERLSPPAAAEPWRLVGVDAVAAALGRSRRWVHGAVKERGLPFVRLDGGALAFDLEDVRAWALDRRVPAVEDDPLAGRLHGARDRASGAASRGRARTAMQKAGS